MLLTRVRQRLGSALVTAGVWLLGVEEIRREALSLHAEDDVVQRRGSVGLSARNLEMLEQAATPMPRRQEPEETPLRGSLQAQGRR